MLITEIMNYQQNSEMSPCPSACGHLDNTNRRNCKPSEHMKIIYAAHDYVSC